MNKLTAEECRELIQRLNDKQAHPMKGLTGDEKLYLPALEIALPILEQQEGSIGQFRCPFPCGWKELLRLSIKDAAFLAQNFTEGVEVRDSHRHAAFRNNDRLVTVVTAMLDTQQERGEVDRPSVRDEDASFELLPGESEYDRLNRMYQWMKAKAAPSKSLAERATNQNGEQ